MKKSKATNPIIVIETINGPREVEKYLLHRVQPDLGWAITDREQNKEIFYHTNEEVVEKMFNDVLEHKLNDKNEYDLKFYAKLTSTVPLEVRPRIIMFEEKHSNRHFVYSTREEFYAIMLYVLTERFESGDWYWEPEAPDAMEMALDEIEKIKNVATKEFALEKYHDYQRELKEFEKENRLYKNIEKAVNEKDGKLAYIVMVDRRKHEYENFETIEPESLE